MTQPEHRQGDGETITVTRSVPLTWMLGIVGAILVWAASQHFGQREIAKEVAGMALKFEAMNGTLVANSKTTTELIIHVSELRRRVEVLEQQRRP